MPSPTLEAICDDFAAHKSSVKETYYRLVAIGFRDTEANDIIHEWLQTMADRRQMLDEVKS